MMNMNFCSLSSGSSGNCYYLGNKSKGILIDAGISATSIRKFLYDRDISLDSIRGILITHNHIDHIRGLELLTRKYSLPVFTTCKIRNSILLPHKKISSAAIREIPLMEKFRLADFDIEAFPVSHDAPETIGFNITASGREITIATDLGYISDTAASYIKKANVLVIESNYDEQMLINGKYPYYLKTRIKSDYGHLGNHQASEFLAEIISDNLTHICLAHLSKNNNTPEIVLETIKKVFAKKKVNLNGRQKITVLNRNVPSEMICLSEQNPPINLVLFQELEKREYH
jgi:phosphoribosyl 1,2-cyclic phosphodiesterase